MPKVEPDHDAPPGFYRNHKGDLVKRRPVNFENLVRLALAHPLPDEPSDAKPA